MPVMLLPPITFGIGRTDAEPLDTAPRFVRTGGMSRWHRPRSGVRTTDNRTIYAVWCGQHVGGLRAARTMLTAETVPDGLPVCATCDGRAVGAGQEQDGPAGRRLLYGPRSLTPPRWCPASRSALYEPLPGGTTGRCLACSDTHPIRAMGGPYASRAAIVQHPPGAALFAPCPFHRWRRPTATAAGLHCMCGRPLTAPQ
ncbi:hypothetical protein QEN61_gp40 [Streptomyces phage Eklok]|uniref:Uncharacterized protein n=1 Tax=Streptomyces phage Eklok TaxID=2743999 RepID=A0A7D5FRT5_9CAUD|nr:hypothetical protein QEN61_gp40 [Streptomyces phage Eklok]QLF83224.1 hypothetical protein SEA_EKLOK_40 [Streptomyces phage Eklok]